ncbi:FAD binding domain-containing protein [Sphingomonas morindae]|uniref:Xanthine dehydrogenase family protein subunit M n=1 Tax=Sphingomonas morindae TaxID=1541170 RepID=A0ABY4XCT6_9SPHN|nr:xanthine dehydrogenase family protein subunit M [Sphingomonas morindae]USI74785.1 xanthine dehydrogenase family protein subunit M [Sphingomonas morindae]
MTPFGYARAADAADAVRRAGGAPVRYLGGGTNLVDLMRETIERPAALVDVTGLSAEIAAAGEGLRIGAAARNTAIAEHRLVRTRYPALARAILAGASAQIRNMATAGGNLLQRTRCAYFYDVEGARCNKRTPGAGCDAIGGFNRAHAILGASEACVATHPSDMAVALLAYDAQLEIEGPDGARTLALADLHRLPGDRPDRDTDLAPGELITAILLPPVSPALRATYRKVRDRASYAFALVSVAGALAIKEGRITEARIALGGVAPKPWRVPAAEAALIGGAAEPARFAEAAEALLAGAAPLRDNGFKIELARRTIVAVLTEVAGGAA